jgi:hypothetical protein
MKRCCFLHVGAAKTGSTSIQAALFHDLRDRRFQYVAGGWANGSFALNSVFDPPPENEWVFHAVGQRRRFEDFRAQCARMLDLAFARARRRGADVVISAESVWLSSREGQSNLLQRLEDERLDVRVIAYVRPWVPWIESMFQEVVKGGRSRLAVGEAREGDFLQVRTRLENLFAVFGRERVSVSLFDPRRFPQGCVVRDFCGQIGFPVPAGRQWRVNESISLEPLKLLFAFNRHVASGGEWSPTRPAGMQRLCERLRPLNGPRAKLHSRFLQPWLDQRQPDDDWLRCETGLSLNSQATDTDSEYAVATEADLLKYSEQTREWLARQVGEAVIKLTDGEAAARAVAAQVDQLRLRPPLAREWLKSQVARGRAWSARRTAGC